MSSRQTCSECGRTFSRPEHCARHMLTHRDVKPHGCDFCGQRFQRLDALQRHMDKSCVERLVAMGAISTNEPQNKRRRVRLACQICHQKKLKCDGAQPCQNCARKQTVCSYRESTPTYLPERTNRKDESHQLRPLSVQDFAVPKTPYARPSAPKINQLQPYDGLNALSNPTDLLNFPNPQIGFDSNFMFFDPDFSMWGDTYYFNTPIIATRTMMNDGVTSNAPKNTDIMAIFENFIRFISPNELSKVDSQVQRYLQTPHIPRAYDLNSLNILINIFMRHITPMFRSFDGFRIDEHTLPEQILGAAAIGAMFSSAPGNVKVARLLYADCSRMVHSYLCGHELTSSPKLKSLVQTYLLMELFGILSGQKRATELSEAHHYALVQEWSDYDEFLSSNESGELERGQGERLFYDIVTIEALRFTLMQLPPILSPFNTRYIPSYVNNMFNINSDAVLQCLNETPGQEISSDTTYQEIALIAVASWNASGRWSPQTYEAGNRRWRAEPIETALLRFTTHHKSVKSHCSSMILCYMIVLSLYVSFGILASTANCVMAKRQVPSHVEETRVNWMQSNDQVKAVRHAKALLDTAYEGLRRNSPVDAYQPGFVADSGCEGPHDAICIYLAALVLWATGRENNDSGLYSKDVGKAMECLESLKAAIAPSFRESLGILINEKTT